MVPRMIEDIANGVPVLIPIGGDQPNDFVVNGDVGRAIILALEAKRLHHQIYHIASGRACTLRDFASVLLERFPSADIRWTCYGWVD